MILCDSLQINCHLEGPQIALWIIDLICRKNKSYIISWCKMFKIFSSQKHSFNINTSPTVKYYLCSMQYVTCQYSGKSVILEEFQGFYCFMSSILKNLCHILSPFVQDFSVWKWLTQFNQPEKSLSSGLIHSLPWENKLPPQLFHYLLSQEVKNWVLELKRISHTGVQIRKKKKKVKYLSL